MLQANVSTIYGKALTEVYKRVASNELGSKFDAPRDVMAIIEKAMEDVSKEIEK